MFNLWKRETQIMQTKKCFVEKSFRFYFFTGKVKKRRIQFLKFQWECRTGQVDPECWKSFWNELEVNKLEALPDITSMSDQQTAARLSTKKTWRSWTRMVDTVLCCRIQKQVSACVCVCVHAHSPKLDADSPRISWHSSLFAFQQADGGGSWTAANQLQCRPMDSWTGADCLSHWNWLAHLLAAMAGWLNKLVQVQFGYSS